MPSRFRLASTDFHDVQPRQANLIDAFAHAPTHFGREDDVVTACAERPSQKRFRLAGGVHVGRVDEIDAAIERPMNERVHF